jgi:hypothetical protein
MSLRSKRLMFYHTFTAELDTEEKKFWHSHDYEVRGGSLALPMPKLMPELGVEAAERQSLLDLQKTYGKTWHTWQVDRSDALPYGTLPPHVILNYFHVN